MAGFVYAVDNEDVLSEKVITDAGLSNIFDGIDDISVSAYNGPGGGKCVLFMGAGGSSRKIKYLPDEQKWVKSKNGKYWIGFYKDDPPTQSELARQKKLNGHSVKLTDGDQWQIPLARMAQGVSALPQSLILAADDQVQLDEIETYSGFFLLATKLWDDFMIEAKAADDDELNLNLVARLKLAIMALNFNYHVGIDEINMLKLIDSENLGLIMGSIIDLPTIFKKIEQDNKKKEITASDG